MKTDRATMLPSAEYAALPEAQRARCRIALNCLEAMPDNLSVTAPGGVLARLARALGTSEKTARRLYYAYKREHRWQVFIDRRSTPPAAAAQNGAQSARFRAWVVQVAEANQRKSGPAIHFIHMAFLNRSCLIPGFETHPGGFVPAGCSETSLRAIIKKHSSELANVRRGLFANKARQLGVLTTRRGLPCGRVIEVDDMWHDNLVVAGGQAVRVLEFGAVDVASGCRIHWGHIPALVHKTENKKTRDGLTQQHFLLFIAYVLRYIGFHKDGLRLVMEHGTATLPRAAEELLLASVPGLEIVRGGFHDAEQTHLSGYAGTRHGNPDTKPRVEGMGNLIHNMLAFLPGQVGRDRQHIQEATYAIEKEQRAVEKMRTALTECGRSDLADCLRNPLLTMPQFSQLLLWFYVAMNNRRNHALEGWEQHTELEYRVGEEWLPAGCVSQATKAELARCMAENPRAGVVREMRLSPAEVWEREQPGLQRIPLSVYVDLLRMAGDEFSRPARVYGGMISLKNKLISADQLHFHAYYISAEGGRHLLPEDATVHVVLNPYCLGSIMILDDRGSILGEAPAMQAAPLGNMEAIHETIGRTMSEAARRSAIQRARRQGEISHAAATRQHNRDLAAEAGLLADARPLPAPRPAAASRGARGMDIFESMGFSAPAAPRGSEASLPPPRGEGATLSEII